MFEVKNPYENPYLMSNTQLHDIDIFNEGAQAQFEALFKWLFGECTDHPCGKKASEEGLKDTYPEHRYLCPACMKELEEMK